jgi:hypothetical protein
LLLYGISGLDGPQIVQTIAERPAKCPVSQDSSEDWFGKGLAIYRIGTKNPGDSQEALPLSGLARLERQAGWEAVYCSSVEGKP